MSQWTGIVYTAVGATSRTWAPRHGHGAAIHGTCRVLLIPGHWHRSRPPCSVIEHVNQHYHNIAHKCVSTSGMPRTGVAKSERGLVHPRYARYDCHHHRVLPHSNSHTRPRGHQSCSYTCMRITFANGTRTHANCTAMRWRVPPHHVQWSPIIIS